MKPKDPIWDFFEIIEDGSKKITKCKSCGITVSAKRDRLQNHRDKCSKRHSSIDESSVDEEPCSSSTI